LFHCSGLMLFFDSLSIHSILELLSWKYKFSWILQKSQWYTDTLFATNNIPSKVMRCKIYLPITNKLYYFFLTLECKLNTINISSQIR
jgi:hypothetical protein